MHEKGHALVRKTAEYQLLLGAIALPGVVIGALLVNREYQQTVAALLRSDSILVTGLGRRNLMMLGFSGYLIFGLAVGCAYDKVIKNSE